MLLHRYNHSSIIFLWKKHPNTHIFQRLISKIVLATALYLMMYFEMAAVGRRDKCYIFILIAVSHRACVFFASPEINLLGFPDPTKLTIGKYIIDYALPR